MDKPKPAAIRLVTAYDLVADVTRVDDFIDIVFRRTSAPDADVTHLALSAVKDLASKNPGCTVIATDRANRILASWEPTPRDDRRGHDTIFAR